MPNQSTEQEPLAVMSRMVPAVPMRRRVAELCVFIALTAACFARPLYQLVNYAIHDAFFSYIPLIPVITIYLIWIKKAELPVHAGKCWSGTLGAGGAAVALLAGGAIALHAGWKPPLEDYLMVMVTSFLLFVVAGSFWFLGDEVMRHIAFPMLFLVFMIPLPAGFLDRTMYFFQQTSAATAAGFLRATGMPVLRTDTQLDLPGFSVMVAPECSGIHSTMVLLITAALAGYMFLRTGWRRAVLAVCILPLAILRNGFRVFVIGTLCVRVNHNMIDSWIHHKGGPVFFALSLIPFFYLLKWLRNSEKPRSLAVEPAVKI
jgi:exosortase C (VPDSG-CTERM-specific)